MPASEKGERMVLAQMDQATEIVHLVKRSKGPIQ
jgi:hypothetical protein